jgi:outer membrane receptor protein involved in Fe transport
MKSIFFYLFLLISIPTFSQRFEGVVYDLEKSSIIDALVVNQRTSGHAHTDINGRFKIENCILGDTLNISYIGNETLTHIISSFEKVQEFRMNPSFVSIREIVITPSLNALNIFTDIDLKVAPVNSSQEILRKVPGLFIGQHAGGGKAEQIFLRGFDIDHGTDIKLTVDGMPVNMISHAHGQGYADLHFLIPETIEKIEFGKGPYKASQGNLATAGYVAFRTKDKLDNNLLKLEIGQFNSQRLLGMFDIPINGQSNLYFAGEYLQSDGPFISPQNFNRKNFMTKYSNRLKNGDQISILASYFDSKWDASGQIPIRAVLDGTINRFGAIDDKEGGLTGRNNLRFSYNKQIDQSSFIKNNLYFSQYDFELYSNFTFFLNDSVNGDQIKQYEDRNIFGLNSEYNKVFKLMGHEAIFQAGIDYRNDEIKDNELSRTANKTTLLERMKFGDVNESNLGGYLNAEMSFGNFTFNPAVRIDQFNFAYDDFITSTKSKTTKSIISPKLNLMYQLDRDLQFFLKTGKGFHSNDSRVILAQTTKEILPSAIGFDGGLIWKPSKSLLLNTAYWQLDLEQEFVYVGDEGVVEPSGRTARKGIDLGIKYEPISRLIFTTDLTYTRARSIDDPEGENFIPLAPDFTLMSGLNYTFKNNFSTGLSMRHLKTRPANEDNSIQAIGYRVVDMNMSYEIKNVNFQIAVQNLLNTEWNETQFATESRLKNETNPVEEIHFTPGTPFNLRVSMGYRF